MKPLETFQREREALEQVLCCCRYPLSLVLDHLQSTPLGLAATYTFLYKGTELTSFTLYLDINEKFHRVPAFSTPRPVSYFARVVRSALLCELKKREQLNVEKDVQLLVAV
jgi:hypothetical protein